MKKLWKHQQYAVEAYRDADCFGLLFDMGMGKTLTAIRIAEEKNKPVVIIAPDNICEQWAGDFADSGTVEWHTLVCRSTTRKKRKFREALERLCHEF